MFILSLYLWIAFWLNETVKQLGGVDSTQSFNSAVLSSKNGFLIIE